MLGGEFDIDVQREQLQVDNQIIVEGITSYSSGRSALYHIIKDALSKQKIAQVMVPDYLCSSVIIPIRKAGYEPVFYPVNDQLELDKTQFRSLYQKRSIVIVINYFGLMDVTRQMNYIRELDESAIVVEDDVQAYYEFERPIDGRDYRFTSLRKWFALPDGGLVKSLDSEMQSASQPNTFHQYKMAGSILKSFRNPLYYDDKVYLQLLEKGENLINDDITCGMSGISNEYIAYTDTAQISLTRMCNAQYLIGGLLTMGIQPILPLTEGKTPLFVPIWLEDRNKIRKAMFQHDVFCPVHWPLEGMPIKKGAEMADHELSLIIDQRYTTKEMDLILNIISDYI